jgi:hypothetical protein
MSIVTEIETVDDQYCFCLRHAGRDIVLFAFRTEKEAQIASDALRQIAQHAVAILPAADAERDASTAPEPEASVEDDEAGIGTVPETESPKPVATSPFLGR